MAFSVFLGNFVVDKVINLIFALCRMTGGGAAHHCCFRATNSVFLIPLLSLMGKRLKCLI